MEANSLSISIPNSELLKILHRTESSEIFHVSYEGRDCCLKVVRQFEPSPLNNVNNANNKTTSFTWTMTPASQTMAAISVDTAASLKHIKPSKPLVSVTRA